MSKPKLNKPNDELQGASVIAGSDKLVFATDIAFDIETAPLKSDGEDASLLDPTTARVAAIGYYDPARGSVCDCLRQGRESNALSVLGSVYLDSRCRV